jgi:hypothetical protein
LDLSAIAEGHLGYAMNPKLQSGEDGGAGYVGIRISPLLTRTTSISTTTLAGTYRREQYFNTFGNTESISGSFAHNQSLSEHLKVGVSANYLRSNNVLLNGSEDPVQIEDFSVGRRSTSISGGASLSWQMSANDSFTADGMYIHQTSQNGGLSRRFDEYLGNFGYLHALNARTQIGFRNNVTFYQTPGQASSRSIGPAIAITQAFNSVWKLDADVGIIFQHLGAPINSDNKGLGFHAMLCGTYPRSSLCFLASRQSSGSAFGGLRRQFSASVQYSYKLTERSSLSAMATYANNKNSTVETISDSDIFRGNVDYNRQLSERLSAGVEARGGYRKSKLQGSARSVAGSAYLRVKIG